MFEYVVFDKVGKRWHNTIFFGNAKICNQIHELPDLQFSSNIQFIGNKDVSPNRNVHCITKSTDPNELNFGMWIYRRIRSKDRTQYCGNWLFGILPLSSTHTVQNYKQKKYFQTLKVWKDLTKMGIQVVGRYLMVK